MNRFATLSALLAGPIFCAGCHKYAPSPLDLTRHQATVLGRDAAAPEVVGYARRLGTATTAPATYNPDDGLGLEEAEAVALFFNPELRLARARAEVPRVGAGEAGRWADPTLAVDGERIVESVQRPWVILGSVSLTLPLSGRLAVERERAGAEATVGELRALAEERRVLGELRQEWVQWSVAVERVALVRQYAAELEQVAGRADRLRAAGELDPVNARVLRLELAKRSADTRRFEADRQEGEARIKARLGLIAAAGVMLVPSLVSAPPRDVPNDAMSGVLAENPRARLSRAEYEVAERTLKLEVRRQFPDLTVGGGFGQDQGFNRVLFGGSMPLPLFNRNRRAIAEAEAERAAARVAAEATYEQLLGEVAAARARLTGSEERAGYVERELVPLADRQVSDAVRLGRAGEFDVLILLEALRASYEAKVEVLETRADVARARLRLATLLEPQAGGTNEVGEVRK